MKPRSVEVREVPGVGFEVVTNGREGRRSRALFRSVDDANAEARNLHQLDDAFQRLGESMGKVDRPRPVLRLWPREDPNAQPS